MSDLTPDQVKLILDWQGAAQHAAQWVQAESSLRKRMIETFFADKKTPGTYHFHLTHGYKLTLTRADEYKLENGNNETEDVLNELPVGSEVWLIKWTPSLIVSNYKTAPPEIKDKFKAVLTIKPSSPQLKMVEPKADAVQIENVPLSR